MLTLGFIFFVLSYYSLLPAEAILTYKIAIVVSSFLRFELCVVAYFSTVLVALYLAISLFYITSSLTINLIFHF
jgi:hypothetical protein